MDLVICEYVTNSRKDSATLIARLQETGHNIKMVVHDISKSARVPEVSYFCVWTDGTVTRGDEALDMADVKTANYRQIMFDETTEILLFPQLNF